MTEIIRSEDVPKSVGGNADPTQAEFEPLSKGQMMAIDITKELPPSNVMNSGLLAELRIGQEDSDIKLSKIKIVKAVDIDNDHFRNLLNWAKVNEIPASGIVLLVYDSNDPSEKYINAAAFLNPNANNILGRVGTLQWNHYPNPKPPDVNPYQGNTTISREQVRIGIFGDRLLLEGLTENSDVEVRTQLPHDSIST